jgi:nucleotide-binding universal stress UspA family protein
VYETILVGTDGSATANLAVQRAAEVARRFDATLVIASAYEPVPDKEIETERRGAPDDISWAINPREKVDELLAEAKQRAADAGAPKVEARAVQGSATEGLLDVADQGGATLIVVGSVGLTGAKRFLLGSVPNRIVHHALVDVLVVRTA